MGTKMKRLTLSFLKKMAAERPIKQNSFLMRKDPIKIDGGWYIQCGSKVRPVALFYTVRDPFGG